MSKSELVDWMIAKCEPPANGRGCLLWTGSTDGQGYAAISYRGGAVLGRNLVADVKLGDRPASPPKMLLMHTCGEKRWLNPEHLRWAISGEISRQRTMTAPRTGGWRLTPDEVLDIRRRYNEGETIDDLAAEHGVGSKTIYMAVTRHSWKWLPDPDPDSESSPLR